MPAPNPAETAARQRQRPWRGRRSLDPRVLGVIALGGILGSEARYALTLVWPSGQEAWPAAIFVINASGSFLIGAVMVLFTELSSPHRLLRPFLGVGVLGGYTTFSTATLQGEALAVAGHVELAVAYLVGTALAAVVATVVGAGAMRAVAAAVQHRRGRSFG